LLVVVLRGRTLAGLSAVVIAVLAVVPASANAAGGLVVSLSGGQLRITGDNEVNDVALVTVTPPGSSSPDLVVGDVSAGIADPIPPFCPRVDPTIIRCPHSMIHGIDVNLGPGNDTLSAKGISEVEAYDITQIYIQAFLGKGRDVAQGSPARNAISGGAGNDMIMGGPLGDRLFGGGQNDFLVGLGGNDLFQCGAGDHDLFNDGPGKDLVNVRTCEKRVHRAFVP
jgi:Ca2+-binding RTX toxin-like protein